MPGTRIVDRSPAATGTEAGAEGNFPRTDNFAMHGPRAQSRGVPGVLGRNSRCRNRKSGSGRAKCAGEGEGKQFGGLEGYVARDGGV